MSYCECQGEKYQGCLQMPNKLYQCYKKDGSIDNTKKCLGRKRVGVDGQEGWTEGCVNLKYSQLKKRMTNWCNKLYQEGIYDDHQLKTCLENLEIGSIETRANIKETEDTNKDLERIYGYYQNGSQKVNNNNPSESPVEDDFTRYTLFHQSEGTFLISDSEGNLTLSRNPQTRKEKDWQLVDLNLGNKHIYALRSTYGKYLIGTDSNIVQANRSSLSPWARWKLIKKDNQYALYSVSHKKYLTIYSGEPLLQSGWNDRNLWLMKEKVKITGAFLDRFDQSDLNIKKEKYLNQMTKYYHTQAELENKILYFKNKEKQLDYLRKQQQDYLMNIASKTKSDIDKNKEQLNNEVQKLKDKLDKVTRENEDKLEEVNKIIKEKCFMNSECLDKAKEVNESFSSIKKALKSITNTIKDQQDSKKNQLRKMKKQCQWSDSTIDAIVNGQFDFPEEGECEQLKIQKENLEDIQDQTRKQLIDQMNIKANQIVNLNKNIDQINEFEIDLKNSFDNLRAEESQTLRDIQLKYTQERKKNMNEYSKVKDELNQWRKKLDDQNKELEKEISNLTDDIGEQLEEINNIEVDILKGHGLKGKNNIKEIAESNQEIIENKVKDSKTTFYLGILILLFVFLMTVFMGFKTYYQYIN